MKIKGLLCATALLGILAACERPTILAGQRFDARANLDEIMPAGNGVAVPEAGKPANRAVPVSLGGQVANSEWSHRAGSASHSMPHLALSANPRPLWSANIGRGETKRARITASPVVAGGKIFALDAQNRLTALSAASGGLVWQVDVTAPGERADKVSGGGLAYGEGRLFVTTGFGELLAISPSNGGVLWRQRFDAPVAGAPTVSGGQVFVAGRDGMSWAVDAGTGKIKWAQAGVRQQSGVRGGSSPAVSGGNVVMPWSAGQIMSIGQAKGEGVWMASVAGERPGRAVSLIGDLLGEPVIAGGKVYVGSSSGLTQAFSAQTGEQLWMAREGSMGAVWPVGNAVYLVSDEGKLVRLDAATGETVWSMPMGHYTDERAKKRRDVVSHYGPVLAGGRLVVASSDGLIRFYAPDSGAPLGSLPLSGGAAAAPAVAGGILYIVTANGQVQAFR